MNRGDVVMVDWPYSDGTGRKLRPALVVQSNALNGLIDDTVLIAITRTGRRAVTEVEVDPAIETASGLRFLSVVVCNNFLTIDQATIHRTIGSLSVAIMQQVDAALKSAPELN